MPNIFFADSITKSFKDLTVLNGIYIKVETGNIIGIFGRNGSGKSTLLKILFGSEKADFSFFKFNNKVLKTPFAEKNCVFLINQESFLPKSLNVKKALNLFSISTFECDFIDNIINHKLGILSLGQLKYLEIFIALNSKCKFVFLDEPFSGLSPKSTEKISELIKKSTHNKGIILVDHDYSNVLKVSNINMILNEGRLKQINGVNELITYRYLNKS